MWPFSFLDALLIRVLASGDVRGFFTDNYRF